MNKCVKNVRQNIYKEKVKKKERERSVISTQIDRRIQIRTPRPVSDWAVHCLFCFFAKFIFDAVFPLSVDRWQSSVQPTPFCCSPPRGPELSSSGEACGSTAGGRLEEERSMPALEESSVYIKNIPLWLGSHFYGRGLGPHIKLRIP